MTTTLSPPSTLNPQPSTIVPPTWNDKVTTCDALTGRISFVWKSHQLSTINPQLSLYYRVSFPPGSPYFDDWAVYRQTEVTLLNPVAAGVSPL